MIRLTKQSNKKNKVFYEFKDFKGGSNKLLGESRLGINEALQATNLVQVEDGLWSTRWGRQYYGATHAANLDGAKEFLKSDGTTEVITIANGKAWKSTDGGAITEITGATFTAGTQCYFMQISGYLYISNGTDPLARYNGTVLTTYTEISAPTGLSASATSTLTSASTVTYWGIVTAINDIGETIGSTGYSIKVGKLRDNFVSTTDKITWSWTAAVGAVRYQLYIADQEGNESYLASTAELKYDDNGIDPINPYVVVPLANTTGAPKFKSMEISGNRIWATNNPTDKYKVYFSGTGNNMGKFSEFFGGGWINLERGGRELPVAVIHYQSGQGVGMATVLCQTPEGRGAVWQIPLTTLTVGDVNITVPSATKVVGSFGTNAILGVVNTATDIMFPNKRGWFGLGPEKQIFGILRTNEISSKIRPYWRSLIGSKLSGIAAYFYDAKILISVPTTTIGNTRTIVLDTERQNWTVDWDFGARQWLETTDSTGTTHLLYVPVAGTQLVEVSENFDTDFGGAINTDYTSGRIALDKLWKDFVRVDKVYIKLGNPRGSINFEVSGTERTKPFLSVSSKTITPGYSLTGLGFDPLGSVMLGDTAGTPDMFSDSADIRYVSIRKKVRDLQLRVTSNVVGTAYTILGFIVEGTRVATRSPRQWKI